MDAIGGQALIEGVMIKAGTQLGVAVRDPSGKILVTSEKIMLPFTKIPFVRGVVNLIFLLWIGIQKLQYSSAIALSQEKQKTSSLSLALMLFVSFIFAIALFKFLPLLITEGITSVVPLSYFLYNVLDGALKICIFVGYIVLLGLMPDMRRVFSYHGAEHKVVNCYEAGKKLIGTHLKKFTTIHARCGTNFIFLVLFLSIFVYTFIPSSFSFLGKLGLRLLLLPVIASVSYEVLRLASRFPSLFGVLVWPGNLMQRLTTREPDAKQLAVAIAALRAAVQKQ